MGYNIRQGMVEENRALLLIIQVSFNRGKELRLRPEDPNDTVYQMQMRIRRLLKATEILEHECEGQFFDLGRKVTLKIDNDTKELVIRARKVITGRVSADGGTTIDEDVALAQLSVSKGTMELLSFTPSPQFDEEEFAERIEEKGWRLLLETKSVEGDNLMYAAERDEAIEQTSVLDRYKA